MAYVNVADWKPDQVVEWLKGLDVIVVPYIHSFLKHKISGQQLLDMQSDDLQKLGVTKLGHQEIILEAIELLRNFHYELDRENLQLLALRLSCLAHSLHNELWNNHVNDNIVPTQVLADVANLVTAVKPLVCWLDRSPFSGQLSYIDKKNDLLKLSLEMATSGQRERFAEKPVENIRQSCKQLADLADSIIQDVDDSLLLQPASLDLATLKKRPGDHLGFYIVPSFHGIHQVGELKCNSAAHQSGKIETGDEIVQINYQTVVSWQLKDVMDLFEESDTEVLLTLKKRPRHSKIFGQIYIKPYRLPCKKQLGYSTRWHDLITPVTVPHLMLPFRLPPTKRIDSDKEVQQLDKPPPSPTPSVVSISSSSSSESELLVPSSPNSVRLYLPKPRMPVQRRATITGASPVSKNAPLSLEQFWHELKLEREWRSNSGEKPTTGSGKAHSETQLRGSSAVNSSLNWSTRLPDHKIPSEPVSLPSVCHRIPEAIETISPEEKPDTKPAPPMLPLLPQSSVVDGIVPLKQRIASLNKASESAPQTPKKPKLLPKPVFDGANNNNNNNNNNSGSAPNDGTRPQVPARIKPITAVKIPLQFVPKDPSISPRRERGKLDKSYSTPSYDYSADAKDIAMFSSVAPKLEIRQQQQSENVKKSCMVVGEGNKSAADTFLDEDRVHSVDSSSKNNYGVATKLEGPEDNAYLEIKSDDNGYLEIKGDDLPLRLDNTISSSSSSSSSNGGCKQTAGMPIKPTNTVEVVDGKQSSSFCELSFTTKDGNISRMKESECSLSVPSAVVVVKKNVDIVGKNISSETDLRTLKDGNKVIVGPIVGECTASEPTLIDSRTIKIVPPRISNENDSSKIHSTKHNMSLRIDPARSHPIDAPSTFPRCKIDNNNDKQIFPAPEPPPRPAKGNSVQNNKTVVAANNNNNNNNKNAIVKYAGKSMNHKSPKSFRKKHPLLAKRRNISVKDLGVCDHEGWLYHRLRKVSRGSPQWIKGWFIIKGTLFYGFNSKESTHARLMIYLPGFTASPAEEVKSRHYAFKVYHTGTTFYFAAECGEDLGGWVESFGRVTVSEEEQSIVMSETDGEEEDEMKKPDKSNDNNSTSHTPAMKKLSGLFSSHLSHHDTSKGEKKYNSLKKNVNRKTSKDDNTESTNNHIASASLDRKYLKFLGGSTKQNIVPVPTAQFRSYRRVPPGNVTEGGMSSVTANSRPDSSTNAVPALSASPTRPPDMADYRLASLAKSVGNNQRTQDMPATGYMTLETFMMSRQEEERRHQLQQEHQSPPLPTQQMQNPRSATLRVPQCHAPPPPIQHIPGPNATASTVVTGREEENIFGGRRSPLIPDTSVISNQLHEHKPSLEKLHLNSLRPKQPVSSSTSLSASATATDNNVVKCLKKTAQYQPPPWESTNNGEESRLHPAFEMTLDSNNVESSSTITKSSKNNKSDESFTGTKFKNLFGGSPRLRRVFFRDKRAPDGTSSSRATVDCSNVARDNVLIQQQQHEPDDAEIQKPTNVPATILPPPPSTTPEYPGLEYPPVFEPGTYSLSDVSTILRSRSLRNCHTNIIYGSNCDIGNHVLNNGAGKNSDTAQISKNSNSNNNNHHNDNNISNNNNNNTNNNLNHAVAIDSTNTMINNKGPYRFNDHNNSNDNANNINNIHDSTRNN